MGLSKKVVVVLVVTFAVIFLAATADQGSGYLLGVCIRNCAMCKKMFGPFFEAPLCAEFCVKYKGKIIPDCDDEDSIRPFIATIKNE